ncbi:PREDICTED: uncharacterized protein LOC109581305 [Amphimedon queenslandica]|uniref:Uncharacterized protein n=1 Tax=Amphimedon queenslandica TaxID=400682 RepID=A0A1X7V249_AMPQE|nr:PREDICTED: uncharacterized protein LOC109581305 [Amphimedon queenslandica]XP_019850878.1 PREDICTED: uncharacterized protein LOC109581305 [Amphimedon queenslandica]XP_019850879.1 PREDICTED: uncharacterized protein LOC109581305 [Amphimedon queenslandica]|eukprot:XP_019850877.1 PREDICTED: uncharacterized protein LOC109581305 [Amphimedon queenslandica]
MGSTISAARDLLKKDGEKAELEQQLEILEKMVNGRLDKEMDNILQGRKGNQEIQTGTIVAIHRQINITDSTKQELDECLSKSLHEFFSGGDYIDGITSIIKLGADTVLGNASIGEYETSDMFIIWNSNALIRCDAYYYRWNFISKGVIEDADGCTGVLLVQRVINATKVDPQVLTWAITNQVKKHHSSKDDMKDGDIEKLATEAIDSAMKVLEKVVGFQVKVKLIEDGQINKSGD